MTISAWDIYLLTRLKSLNLILLFATAIPFIFSAFCFATNQLDGSGLSTAKRFLIGSVIAGLLWIAIPNEKEAAAMYVLPKLVNNEAAQNLPKDLASLVHDWAEELSTRTKKKGDRE